jgi:hypothetical protein
MPVFQPNWPSLEPFSPTKTTPLLATHCPLAQGVPAPHVPHEPPHPSSPQVFPLHRRVQVAGGGVVPLPFPLLLFFFFFAAVNAPSVHAAKVRRD